MAGKAERLRPAKMQLVFEGEFEGMVEVILVAKWVETQTALCVPNHPLKHISTMIPLTGISRRKEVAAKNFAEFLDKELGIKVVKTRNIKANLGRSPELVMLENMEIREVKKGA